MTQPLSNEATNVSSAVAAFVTARTPRVAKKGPIYSGRFWCYMTRTARSIGPVILNGRPDKGMPHFAFTPEQITDIANFLHNAVNAAADRDNYKILNIVTGDSKAGEAYFTGAGQCTSCHSVTGDLKGIATKYDPPTLQGKFIQPGFTWMEGNPPKSVFAISVTVTLPSGEKFTGRPVALDDFNVSLREADGSYHSFARTKDGPKIEINNRLQAHMDLGETLQGIPTYIT